MSVSKSIKNLSGKGLSMKGKFVTSMLMIGAVLLISCIISLMEFTRMKDYVTDLIAEDINSINVANRLAEMSNRYNLDILATIGDGTSYSLPEFDQAYFKAQCDSLRLMGAGNSVRPMADSVMYAYAAYMLTSNELEDVIQSDFIDTRSWFFGRLQPQYERLHKYIDRLIDAIHGDLEKNSATFERGFYRSIIPGIVAVGVGMLLLILLLLFVLWNYVTPLYKMLDELKAYKANDKKYSYEFDGDDQLNDLNEGIKDLAVENRQLRERVRALRAERNKE